MSRIYIEEFLKFGATTKDIEVVDWEVFQYDQVTEIIGDKLFESIGDSLNKLSIVATLESPNGDLYDVNLPTITFVRVKAKGKYTTYFYKVCGGVSPEGILVYPN